MSAAVLEHPLVRDYLRRLDAACAALPYAQARELRDQIIAHLDEALPPRCRRRRGRCGARPARHPVRARRRGRRPRPALSRRGAPAQPPVPPELAGPDADRRGVRPDRRAGSPGAGNLPQLCPERRLRSCRDAAQHLVVPAGPTRARVGDDERRCHPDVGAGTLWPPAGHRGGHRQQQRLDADHRGSRPELGSPDAARWRSQSASGREDADGSYNGADQVGPACVHPAALLPRDPGAVDLERLPAIQAATSGSRVSRFGSAWGSSPVPRTSRSSTRPL